MNNKYYSLISLSLLVTIYSSTAVANIDDLYSRCLAGVPQFSGELMQGNPNQFPVYIEADQADIHQLGHAIYSGNVDVKQGMRQLKAEKIEIMPSEQGDYWGNYVQIKGDFDYQDNQIHLKGKGARINLDGSDTEIDNAQYQLVSRQGYGIAQNTKMTENYRILKNASFTSCTPNDNAWQIDASEIKQHIKEEYAEMWHARFKVAGVPIFYLPYLQLPTGDRRRSGLLIPNVGSSHREGYWYAQPIYWNIAPNYDFTFTPKYMSQRGWQLNSEFRYLNDFGQGKLASEYLYKDLYDKFIDKDKSRHLFYWHHNARLADNWRLQINYTKVSDKNYFGDFSSKYGRHTDGHADQAFRLSYYQPNWNFSIGAKQFQIFDNTTIGPYHTLPQIDFNYHNLSDNLLRFKLFAQAVHFANDSADMPTAWRYHLEPSVNFPLSNRYGSLNIDAKWYATYYQQKAGKGVDANIKATVTRVLPQLKIDLQTVLANSNTIFKGYTQTLEPRIQYLYRPYQDQSEIGSKRSASYLGLGYDSALLQQDYFSLFSERRYSGLDRISSANQITLGGTTRFYDEKSQERFNLSLGQIIYLNDSRVDVKAYNSNAERSSWVLQSHWKLNNQWNWQASYQYDASLKSPSLVNSTLEFNPQPNNLVQLNYRYASRKYIDQNVTSKINSYEQDIQQLGGTIAWEIGDKWAAVGRYYHDLALNKPVEQYLGLQYNTCCWAAGVNFRRYLVNEDKFRQYQDKKDTLYDHRIGINFELRGLGGNNHSSGIVEMLGKGMLPYIRPFNL